VVRSKPFAYSYTTLPGGAKVVSESVDVPSYQMFVISVRVGSIDETAETLGMTTIIKEYVKMELS
jgi:hypothetical protein